MYDAYKHIKFERDGTVLTATLNRPEVRNAINPLLDAELVQLFRDVDMDDDCNVLILTGAGESFCAGGDVKGMRERLKESDRFEKGAKNGKRILQGILDCDKPIVCRMNGDAMGLGATIALYSDLIIAAETARIGDPHVRVGLVAGDGGAMIWPQLIGYARAKQYLLTGDFISAKEAAEIGLINFAVPAAELDAKVGEWATKLAKGAPKAIKWTKAAINIGLKMQLAATVDAGFALEVVSSRTEDYAEAVHAFTEKRKPVFRGK